MTTAEAIVRWAGAQRTRIEGDEVPLFPGVFAIFGHGNVTCLGHALQEAGALLPTWRGQNEQGMALAAVAYAKAKRRRQVMICASSIGPGALNMVTAAGVAMADRLPLLLLAGDTFSSRGPDPVLQQVEHPGIPSITANDAFRAVVRFWDRITRPDQLLQSLPQALRVLLDPAECGPVLLALPQDVQADAFDFPAELFQPTVHVCPRARPDRSELKAAASILRFARRPLLVAGGGVHYSLAEEELAHFAERHGIPVAETMAGRSSLVAGHPRWAGPIGVTGWSSTNSLAAAADVILAVGTRLGDFTTGSWTVFASEGARMIGLNAARFDSIKHGSQPLVCDAMVGLEELSAALGGWKAEPEWAESAQRATSSSKDEIRLRSNPDTAKPTYAQVVAAVNRLATAEDYVVTAAGGLPGELNANWLASGIATFDCEYGFSCMGYEISGGWGARMARDGGQVFVLVGDGSYLMLNSDLYSSVLYGQKMIVVVCDNGGYAVIERLQTEQGGVSFNNMLDGVGAGASVRADFSAHAASMGCLSETVTDLAGLEEALGRARHADRTSVIVIETDPDKWSGGGSFWEVGVPEVSVRSEVREARSRMDLAKKAQRLGYL